MKIIFSHWCLWGTAAGNNCYYLGENLAKLGEEVVIYTKKINKDVKYSKIKRFSKNFENRGSVELIKDAPDFLYSYRSDSKIFSEYNKKFPLVIEPVFYNPLTVQKKNLNGEKPKYYFENSHQNYYDGYNFSDDEINNEREIIKKSKNYLICSGIDNAEAWIGAGYNKKKVFNLPKGIDTQYFKPKPIKHKKIRILFVGNAATRKGLPYLLDAFTKLRRVYKNIELNIISNWIKGLEIPDTRLYNRVPYKKMREMYNKYDILVLPSLEDASPQCVLEAMACGLPIIITKDIGFNNLFNNCECGYYIDKKNTEDIYKKIELLINNKEKIIRMGVSARKIAKNNDWSVQAKKLKKILYQIKLHKD